MKNEPRYYCEKCLTIEIKQDYDTLEHKEMIMTYDDKTLETNK